MSKREINKREIRKREISKVVVGSQQVDGAGVKLVRVIGYDNVYDFDPFLMLDAFDSSNSDDYIKGFPWHPHRGIETVTYLVQGEIEHGDSMGNKGTINDGCCQWMTAGKAIIHQEMPQPSQRMLGLQLWLNLPRKDKMVEPKYRDIRSEMIPVVEEPGSTVRILSGYYKEQAGAMQGDYIKATVLDVTILPDTTWSISTDPEETVFTYILEGTGSFGGNEKQVLEARRAILFSKGDELEVSAGSEMVRIVLFMGKPLHEPIAWGGPIVMNTSEELEQAFREIREGTFVKA